MNPLHLSIFEKLESVYTMTNNKNSNRLLQPKIMVSLAVTLFFAACSSQKPIPGMKDSFQTEIAPNGAKRFTFTVERKRRDILVPIEANSDSQRRMQRQPIRRGSSRRVEEYFDWALEQKMLETGFCEQGYFEIERTISEYGGEVRGECREGAF